MRSRHGEMCDRKAGAPIAAGASVPEWVLAGLLVSATILAYQPVWHAGFIWDDGAFVVDNPLIQAGNGLYGFWCTTAAPDYFPMTSSTLWLEWRLWGSKPLGYHLVNVLLHAASSVVLWRALSRLKIPGAWLAAAIFALHPVNVESVAWITERKNTLAMFFYAWALLWYLRFDDEAKARIEDRGLKMEGHQSSILHPPSWRFSRILLLPSSLLYCLSLIAFALALLSKTAVVPMGAVLLGLVWWRRGRIECQDVWRIIPFFVMSGALSLITIWFQYHRAIGPDFVRADGPWGRLAGAGWAVWFYLYKALWPVNLMFIYPRWSIDASKPLAYVPGLMIVAVLVLCWVYRRSWGRPPLFALGYFILMLLPVLGFLDIYFMRYSLVADHWQYFAILGPIALVTAVLTGPSRPEPLDRGEEKPPCKIEHPTGTPRRTHPRLRVALSSAVLVVLGLLTWNQCRIYAGEETLWRDTLNKNPACWLAHLSIGSLLIDKGQSEEAIRHFQEAIRLKSDYPTAYNNLGSALDKEGHTDEAIGYYHEALRLKPDMAEAHNNLGIALATKGQIGEAIQQHQEAIRLRPRFAQAHYSLGNALARSGQTDAAISQYQEALHLKGDYIEALNNLGLALASKGRLDAATRQFQDAIRLKPDFADAYINLGSILAQQGQLDEAIRQFQQAVRLRPDDADARANLARALEMKSAPAARW